MTNDKALLDFVKSRLEEGEVLSPKILSRLMAAARNEAQCSRHQTPSTKRKALLTAASLTIVTAGWLVLFNKPSALAPQPSTLSTTIALLRVADGTAAKEESSLADNLLAWQDAPANLDL